MKYTFPDNANLCMSTNHGVLWIRRFVFRAVSKHKVLYQDQSGGISSELPVIQARSRESNLIHCKEGTTCGPSTGPNGSRRFDSKS